VNTSTIFAVGAEKRTNRIIMYTVHGQSRDNMMDVMDESSREKPGESLTGELVIRMHSSCAGKGCVK
jgi:hypothetical protein